MAFGDFVVMRDLDFDGPARRHLLHHGRQRVRQEHAPPPHDRPERAGARATVWYGDVELHRGVRRRNASRLRPPLRHPVSERRAVELHDARRERRPAARAVHRSAPAEIGEVAALKLALVGLRGFEDYYPSEISGGMQKRAGAGARHRARPGGALLRRAVGGARSGQLAAARRPHPVVARQPRAPPSSSCRTSSRASSRSPTTASSSTPRGAR